MNTHSFIYSNSILCEETRPESCSARETQMGNEACFSPPRSINLSEHCGVYMSVLCFSPCPSEITHYFASNCLSSPAGIFVACITLVHGLFQAFAMPYSPVTVCPYSTVSLVAQDVRSQKKQVQKCGITGCYTCRIR